jgi:hypothetical protein
VFWSSPGYFHGFSGDVRAMAFTLKPCQCLGRPRPPGSSKRRSIESKKQEIILEIIDETLKDYTEMCRQKLVSIFPKYVPTKKDDPIYDIEKYIFRRILPKKRKVHISSHLKNISDDFKIPVQHICKDIEEGRNLHKYQSRLLKKSNFNDAMLGDWGIHHLHLSTKQELDGYVKRTNELLFVRFTEDDAFLIGIFVHGEWTNSKIIEIIHNELPQSIETFIMHGITPAKEDLTDKQRSNARSKGVNTAIQMKDGTVYMGPGMGLVFSGAPAYAIMKADSYIKNLERSFLSIKDQIDIIEPEHTKHAKLSIGMFLNEENEMLLKIKETGKIIKIDEK